jgi:hypothetical protein
MLQRIAVRPLRSCFGPRRFSLQQPSDLPNPHSHNACCNFRVRPTALMDNYLLFSPLVNHKGDE